MVAKDKNFAVEEDLLSVYIFFNLLRAYFVLKYIFIDVQVNQFYSCHRTTNLVSIVH